MNHIYKYNINNYCFDNMILDKYQKFCKQKIKNLNELHIYQLEYNNNIIDANNYKMFTDVGKDTDTIYHKIFYEYIKSDDYFKKTYDLFIQKEVIPIVKQIYPNDNQFLFQTLPSFRVQLPNNVAVTEYHYDSMPKYNHPDGEINFILPITEMFDTNTVWAESQQNKGDFKPMNMEYGDLLCWNFNKCYHGNKMNQTGLTRISMDFRVLPMSKYNENNLKTSASSKKKFIIGDYYSLL